MSGEGVGTTPPAGVQVAAAPHNPECWLLSIAGRTVCWRFWPAIEGGKRPHEAFVTLEGWPHGPVSADDMDRLAGAATAVADRIRTDQQLATDHPTPATSPQPAPPSGGNTP